MNKNAIIIPTLNPTSKIIELVKDLINNNFKYIIVVDDGSSKEYSKIFKTLEELGCYVYHHKINKGKGSAIKTGIRKALKINDITGIITVDSDGQHQLGDIKKVAKCLDDNQNKLVLGVRDLKKENVPLRSRVGNSFSRLYFFLSTRKKLKDTQTGLRGIPLSLIDYSLSIKGNRYDYEMNYLLDYARKNDFVTVPIQTIYEDNNKSSHFKTIKDSLLIYKNFFICLLFFIIVIFMILIFTKVIN